MDLEVLNLKADASSVDKATASVEDLEKKLSRTERAVAKAEEALKILRGELVQVGNRAISLGDGFTKSQANMLAMLKQAGATTAELKAMAKTMDQLNKITSTNPFDKSVQALEYVKKQREELTKSIKYAERYNDLTKEQISLMTRGIESVRQRAASEQKNFGEREAAVKRFIKEFVKESQSYNQVTAAIEEKNRVAKEELRIQQEIARAAQVSAKQRSDAEKYVQETLQRTLFINEQLEKGMSVSGANSLYAYKQQLDVLGLSADQAAAKMKEFQGALMSNQALRSNRNPLDQINTQLKETTQGVNQLARAVSVQMGDVFVSLAGGMNPLLVAIQQGDQVRFALEQAAAAGQSMDKVMQGAFASMANSFLLVGKIVSDFLIDGFKALGNVFNGLLNRLPVLGDIITGWEIGFKRTAAQGDLLSKIIVSMAGAANIAMGAMVAFGAFVGGVFIASLAKVDMMQTQLARSIGLYGASLGVTVGQIQTLVKESDRGSSALTTAITAIAKAGGFTKDQLMLVAESAVEMNKVFGSSIEDVVNEYKKLQDDPVKALLELEARTGNVDDAVIRNVKNLKEQGKTYDAISAAMVGYAEANKRTTDQTVENLGYVARVLNTLSSAWEAFYKGVENFGKKQSDQALLMEKLASLDKIRSQGGSSIGRDKIIRDLENEVKVISERISLEVKSATVRREEAESASFLNTMQDRLNDGYSKQEKYEIGRAKRLEDIARLEKMVGKGGVEAKDVQLARQELEKFDKEYQESLKKANAAAEREAAKTQKYFEKLMEGATDLALRTEQELSKLTSGYEQMTDSQKALFDAQNDPRWKELTERQREEYSLYLKKIEANEELIRQYNAQIALQEMLSKWSKEYASTAASIQEEVVALELRNNLLFKTEDEAKAIQRQYDLNVKLAAVENKYIERRNQMMMDYVKLFQEGRWTPEALAQYQSAMANVDKQEAEERRLAHEGVNTAIREDYAAKFKEIQSTVTDIIATAMFEGGKAGSKKLKDVLKAEFRKYVIKVFIEPVVGQVMGTIFGQGSTGGGSSFGLPSFGSADIGSNIAGGLQSIGGSLMGSGFSDLGQTLGNLGNTLNSWNTALKNVPGFSGGVSSTLGYANAIGTAIDGNYGKALGQAVGTYFGGPIGSAIGGAIGDALGWEKKPSDKTSWAVIDPTTGRLGEIGDMGGKKAASEEQKTANTQLSQLIGGFAGLAGITGQIVTAMGSRDGVRLAITGGFKTPQGSAGGGAWLGGKETIYSYGSDPATAAVKMMEDLLDEGTLSQTVIDSWNSLKTTTEGTTKDAVELISNLNLLVAGYDELSIKRADLLQMENETLEVAYARMLQYEKAISGTALPGDALADSARALVKSFERLNVSVPTTTEQLNVLISGLDLTTSSGQASYVALMNLVPAFLELKNAQEELYNQLLTDEQQASLLAADVSKAFSQLGVSMPRTREELRKLIDAQNVATESGAVLKAQLLGLVPAFVEMTTAAEAASKAFVENANSLATDAMSEVDRTFQALQKAVETEKKIVDDRIKSLSDNLTRLKAVFDFLKNAIDGLLRSASSTNAMQLAQANALIKSVVVSGIIPDDKSLEDAVGVAVEGVEKGVYASRADQERATILLANDLSKINSGVADQVSETERLIRIEEKELDRLESILLKAQQQLDALNGINTSVLSVKDAIDALAAAVLGANAAKISAAAAPYIATQSAIGASYAASGGVVNSAAATPVTAAEKSIASVYQNVLGREADIGGLQYWVSTGMSISQIEQSIQQSAEAAARAVSVDVQNAFIQGVNQALGQASGIKAYADGGYYSGGLALVGEQGPEIINFSNPGMVYTAAQTSNLLSGNGNLEEVFEELRQEVVMLRAETRAVVSNTSKSAKLLDRAMPDGQSILVTTTA